MINPALACASRVDAPRCGVNTTLGAARSGLPTGGSMSNTSTAAPDSFPDRNASASAASWTISPRAQFTRMAPRFIWANSAAATIPFVSGVRAACTLTTSASRKTVSLSTRRIPTVSAVDAGRYGSYAMTRIPNACARFATSAPIRPEPTRPRVFSNSSRPSSFFFSHRPSLTDRSASGRCRRREIMWPIASSDADRARRGGVHDRNLSGGGLRNIDVVDADSRATHDLQVRSMGQDRLGHDGPAPDDESVVSSHDVQEAFWIDLLHVDLMLFPEGGDRLRFEPVGDEDFHGLQRINASR